MSGAAEQVKGVISGGVGGMCLVLAGHPFDLVKTRLQTAAAGQYPSGAMDVVRASLREGGARALFRGMSAPLMGVTPIFAICIWAYGVGKDIMRAATGARTDGELSLAHIGVAGALSAVPTTAVMAPGERVKVLLLVPRAPGLAPYTGPADVVRQLVRTEGLGSLFRGSAVTLLRDGVGSFAYFGAYEGIKRYTNGAAAAGGEEASGAAAAAAPGKAAPPSVLSVLAGGSAAGIANWLVALPCVRAGGAGPCLRGAGRATRTHHGVLP
jgi:solute carrier family 25 carnitine/acylcarnitine transporter 20/29